jgi:phage/plasmid-associated DNA primase
MRAHLRDVIAGRDEATFQYVLGWLAHAVQYRGDRGLVALVLRGDRGVGKGILGQVMMRIFGQHAVYVSNTEQLVGKFNAHLEDCSFLFGDECFFPHDKKHLSTLKALITESTLPVEAKFEPVRMVRNCLHLLLASNEQFVVPAGRDERRFAVLDVADTHKQDRRYFDPLRQELGLDQDTDGKATGAAAMLYDLLAMDLSSFDITAVPKTLALLEQKLNGMSACGKWLCECLERGTIAGTYDATDWWERGEVNVDKQLAYQAYRDFSKLTREYRPEETGPWMKELKKMLGDCVQDSRPRRTDGSRPRVLTFKPLADCRDAYNRWIGHPMQWQTSDEVTAELYRELYGENYRGNPN